TIRWKGPAVRGPRAQADRKLYREAMQAMLAEQANLDIREDAVADIVVDARGTCRGVLTESGAEIAAGRVVLTTGTFLRGLIHLGEIKIPAGRARGQRDGVPGDLAADSVEEPSAVLARGLHTLGFPLRRLTTAAPPPGAPGCALLRISRARAAGRRSAAAALLLFDRQDHDAPGRLPYHDPHGGDARPDPGQPASGADVFRADRKRGSALLPVDR